MLSGCNGVGIYNATYRYPDMLEVGVTGQNGHSEGGLSYVEQRTHFGLCTPHCLGVLQPLLADTQVGVSRSCRVCHIESTDIIVRS